MIDVLQRLVASLLNRVRVNEVRRSVENGIPVVVKRRRWFGSFVIWFGNQFLRVAHSGICMFVRRAEWLDWEVYCARLLYPERNGVRIGSDQSLIVPEIRGSSLRQLIGRRESLDAAFRAAARELLRAHQLPCRYYQGCWSHGDLHLDNIIYDAEADRAFFIDFDTRHEFTQKQTQRHSDDLCVVLLELIATLDEDWPQPATVFLAEYPELSVLEQMGHRLFIPGGFGKLFWFTRTNSCSLKKMQPRIQKLREIVRRVTRTTGTENSIESPRGSINGEQS